jgi:ADP-ribosylglycohydrolase
LTALAVTAPPPQYEEQVYAGVLGKLIGVYLGRPVEMWTHGRIVAELGELDYYVHDRADLDLETHALLVVDDDITGTFALLRALADVGYDREITAAQIGEAWLNYAIPGRTIFWWGGLGNSTEHTAWLRLSNGVAAPESGSSALNGKLVAEQIGAQIFIDGWAMVAPGDPQLASELARRAASVSHDGEAVYGAQVIAALEAQAFVEKDIGRLLDAALAFIPADCVIARMIDDIRGWHRSDGDWRATRARIEARYGYDSYGGNCHVVPNHGLIINALLYGEDDFQRSLMIVNTSGWDTDCNSGNLGCLLGIKNGLRALDAGPDWRGPVADRMYAPTADGGGAITDAVIETFKIVNTGRALAGIGPLAPKAGARFHFELPGALQGFRADQPPSPRRASVLENVPGNSEAGRRSLAVRYGALTAGELERVATATFILPDADRGEYELIASPTLHPGQLLRARLVADGANDGPVTCALFVRVYDGEDRLTVVGGSRATVEPGAAVTLDWRVGDTGGQPIAEVGVELTSATPHDGTVYLDYLTWDGSPDVTLSRPRAGGAMWASAWVVGVDELETIRPEPLRLIQNRGTGLIMQGGRGWTDYELGASIVAHLAAAAGIAVRVQGLRRYYALLLDSGGSARLVKSREGVTVLAETEFPWQFGKFYAMALSVEGARLRASVDGEELFEVHDEDATLASGGIGILCREGCVGVDAVTVRPAS